MAIKKWWIFVLIVIFVAVVYLTFFYTKKCQDKICFEKALRRCNKASYTNDAEEAVWHYEIKGKAKGEFRGNCKVDTEIKKLKTGDIEMLQLEGKSMDCYLPLNVVDSPEKDLTMCHGRLKEEMQNIIIQKTHAYILGNIGKISKELEKAI